MRILYLCKKRVYESKMSRCRFASIDAIKRYPGVKLKKSGPGWGDFNMKTIEKSFKPDLIVWYKPLTMKNWQILANSKVPKCIRYNEAWNRGWTKHEIKTSKSGLVICHHYNDISRFKGKLDPSKYKLIHNPHCAEKGIFKNYEQKKDVDVLLVGVVKPKTCYPLRFKFDNRVKKKLRNNGVTVKIFKHPGYRLNGLKAIQKQTIRYAKAINRAKIVFTDASDFHYALAKYAEIPMCYSALCGDIPRENEEWYGSWMIKVKQSHSAKEIKDKIIKYLRNPEKLRELTIRGYQENMAKRTQEHYAERFLSIADDYLCGKLKDYDFRRDSEKYLNGGAGVYHV